MHETQYVTIANTLRERIRKGEYSPGESLGSQKELAEIFNTTVMTVRQAISVLESEGLITVVHGSGTFVNSGSMKGRDLKLKGFSDGMERYKLRIGTQILKKEFNVRDERAQRALGTGSDGFCRISRLRTLDDTAIIFQRSYLIPDYAPIVENLTDGDSLYSSLNLRAGGVVEGREIIKPVALGIEEAASLGEKPGTLALLSLRISFNLSSLPVLYDEAYLRNGRVICAIRESGNRRSFNYSVPVNRLSDPISELLEPEFWEES
jgi:GntR family transcriptional regulator